MKQFWYHYQQGRTTEKGWGNKVKDLSEGTRRLLKRGFDPDKIERAEVEESLKQPIVYLGRRMPLHLPS